MKKCSTAVVRVVLTAVAASMMVAANAEAQAGSPIPLAAERQSTSPGAGAPGLCGALAFCYETLSFAARITDFQANLQNGSNKTVTVRLSFRNKLSRPLVLGYVAGSGVATDDRGHKYTVNGDRAVQGIGAIQGTVGDQKFVLQPGEASDARFELAWYASPQEIFGLSFQVDLAIREIDPIPGNQLHLGREHALHFSGLENRPGVNPATSRTTTAPVSSGLSGGTPASPSPAPSQVDSCVGNPRCYNAGSFVAEVTSLTASFSGNGNAVHVLKASVRFRNTTNQPVVLGYIADSAVVTDNYGARYQSQVNQRGDGAAGIGTVTHANANPQFVLAPGASRDATFTVSRYKRDSRIGSAFTFDLTIAHLEVLAGDQIHLLREYAVGFTALTAGGGSFLDRLRQPQPR
jgi:hypothetical protein